MHDDSQGAESDDEDAYFQLSFSPNVSLVSTVRRFVSEFYVQVLGNAEVTSRLALATHELLDNAVRYSSDGHSSIRIGVKRDRERVRVKIDTTNRAPPEHIDTLKRALEEIAAATDPDKHYLTLMRRTAKRTEGSGLGLGRIRAETDMQMAYRIEGDTLHLRAHGLFDTRSST